MAVMQRDQSGHGPVSLSTHFVPLHRITKAPSRHCKLRNCHRPYQSNWASQPPLESHANLDIGGFGMVADEEIVARLQDILKTSDLNTTTTGIVRRRLEEDLGIDLSERKAFVREQVDLFLQSQVVENGKEEDEVDKELKDEEVEVNGEGWNSGEDEEEEEVEEECSDGYKTRKRRSKKIKTEVKRKGGGGFCKVCSLSPQLQEFTGTSEMARTEVVKLLWAYIKEKNLQDPSNKRNILCDKKLKDLFKVDCINMFQMNKVLAKHIWPLESDEAPVKQSPKEKKPKKETEEVDEEDEEEEKPKQRGKRKKEAISDEDENEPKKKGKRQGNSGFLAPLKLSDALMKFLGTGESELSRSEVVKRIWTYIKENSLQDPSDKRQIGCDEKLKELFEVDSFHGFTVSKLLTAHLTKLERSSGFPFSGSFLKKKATAL